MGGRAVVTSQEWPLVGDILTAVPIGGVLDPSLVWRMQRVGALSCWQVNQTRGGIEGHGIPVMRATGRGGNKYRVKPVIGGCGLDRPSAPRIDSGGPGNLFHERLRGKEPAGIAIEDVEEAVLRRLHDDLARGVGDVQVGEH